MGTSQSELGRFTQPTAFGEPLQRPTNRTIMHADLDAFYASVEQRDNPTLRGKPVLVGMGVVTAASYEAKRCGVRCPTTIREAKRLCPDAIVVPARMHAYSEASKAVFSIFHETTPEVEGISIDEAFLDVTGLWRLVGDGATIATTLRSRVANEVGLPLSVGVATTKFLAKVASAAAKPDGLCIVEPGSELDFLHPLPVEVLWGVGPVTAQKLHDRGIRLVGDLARLDEAHIVDSVGRAAGHHLFSLANNRDPRRVVTGKRRGSIGSQRSFAGRRKDLAECNAMLLDIVDRVSERLRRANRLARTVVLRLRFGDFVPATRSHTLDEPTNQTAALARPAQRLLAEVWPTTEERGLTRIGLSLTGLSSAQVVQLTLPFGNKDMSNLDRTLDELSERFGKSSVRRAANLGRTSWEVPMLPD